MIYSINEGQQAEEYKERRSKEAQQNALANIEREHRRYGYERFISTGDKHAQKSFTGRYYSLDKKDQDRQEKANDIAEKEVRQRDIKAEHDRKVHGPLSDKRRDSQNAYNRMVMDKDYARDAANRHIRRHPKQYKEGTIFESVEFI